MLHGGTTAAILGAFYAVHSEVGFGFLEAVYENALVVLVKEASVEAERQVPFEILFHGHPIGRYHADLIDESGIIVEIKAGRGIIPQHTAQLLNYLRASSVCHSTRSSRPSS